MTTLAWVFVGIIGGMVAYVIADWYDDRHGKEDQ